MTDKRPIDANALYEDVSRMGLTNGSALGRHSGMADAIAQMIQDAPTIDPESLRGHAKWEKPENLAFIIVDGPDDSHKEPAIRCSNCGGMIPESDFDKWVSATLSAGRLERRRRTMAKARAIDAVALYKQIAAEVSSMLKQPPGIIVSKIMAMVLQAPTIGSSEAKEDVPDDRFDVLAAPWARKIRAAFPAAFVNMHNELILIPKANTYIMLNQVRDERDFKAAVLEDCSRNAFKGCSRKLQDEHLDGINKLLDTKFTRDDMELIYTYLGNGIQHDLCLRFVASGYDLEIIREEERKQ